MIGAWGCDDIALSADLASEARDRTGDCGADGFRTIVTFVFQAN